MRSCPSVYAIKLPDFTALRETWRGSVGPKTSGESQMARPSPTLSFEDHDYMAGRRIRLHDGKAIQ
jgi:hypothetical protein